MFNMFKISTRFQPCQAAVSKFLDCVGVNVVFTKTKSQGFLGADVAGERSEDQMMDSLSVASNKYNGLEKK